MKESVRVVNRAKDITGRKFVKVAASVGPYAVLLADGSEYSGVYGGVGEEQIERFHREKIRILLEEKPDFLALETIPNLMEARILVKVLEEFPNAKAWICACCIDEARLVRDFF
jgi:homocysteine S-methyltransferase